MQGKEGKGDRRILRKTWRRDGVASGRSDAWKMRLSAFLLLAIPFLAPAETIDRIAVSVGPQVITSSDIDREIRVAAFLDCKPADFSPAARRAAAGRMVEQRLIRRELEISRYPVPSLSGADPVLDKIKQERYPTGAAWRQALSQQGVSEQDVIDERLWQRTLSYFIDLRFRSGVQVSDEEIRDYFEKTVKPLAEAARPGQSASRENYRGQIEDTLAGRRADEEADKWLAEARARTVIIYHEEAFQ